MTFRLARSDLSGLSISETTKGARLLLVQLLLNSAELHELLKSVKADSQRMMPLLVKARMGISAFARGHASAH